MSYLLFLSIILEKQEKYDMQHSWHVQSQHLPIFTFVIMFGKHQLNLKSLCWYIFLEIVRAWLHCMFWCVAFRMSPMAFSCFYLVRMITIALTPSQSKFHFWNPVMFGLESWVDHALNVKGMSMSFLTTIAATQKPRQMKKERFWIL